MELTLLIPFLLIIALASYVQTVTGFALGMIVMGGVTMFNLLPIAFTSVIISIVSFANCVVALKGNSKAIDFKRVLLICCPLFPMTLLGLWLLNFMSAELNQLLQGLLGVTIIAAGFMIMLKPEPLSKPSHPGLFILSGAAAGFLAGLFSMAGPALVYLLYRQPFSMQTIRLCLLSVFLLSAVVRTSMVAAQGQLTLEMITFSLICLPIVTLATWLGKHYPPPLTAQAQRHAAFFLLILIGVSLVIKNLWPLLG